MSAASELSGWLLVSTSSAAVARSVICQAVTAPNATTSRASDAPMMRSRPGSVVAAARSWSTPSAKAVRRAGAAAGHGRGTRWRRGPGGPGCGGTAGIVGTPDPGGAVLLFGGCVTLTSPMVIRRRKYRRRMTSARACTGS